MDKLNKDSPSAAYQTGRMLAVYAALQNKALGDVNAGVAEKYFTSACTSPQLVMGKLAALSQYHLSKLEGGGKYYKNMLNEIATKIGGSFPKTMTLEQQGEFALGYYHQNAEMYSPKSKTTEE